MDNIKKLRKIGILGNIREFLGADNPQDDSCDVEINKLDNSELIELWFRYRLGDGSWWTDAKNWFDQMEAMDKQNESKPV